MKIKMTERSTGAVAESSTLSPRVIAWRRLSRHRLAIASLVFIALVLLVAALAPLLAPYDPDAVDLSSYQQPPSSAHWFGTDSSGRDVLTRLIYGARISAVVGLSAAASAALLGMVLGLCAGVFGGWVDATIMRLMEVFLSFPSLIIIILLVSVIGPSVWTIVLVIALFEWPAACRVARQMSLSIREADYVRAARAIGSGRGRIMFRHVLLGIVSPLSVVVTLLTAQAILLEAALSFLGLGVPMPQSSWGGMLQAAQSLNTLEGQPWLWLPPGVAIVLTVLAVNFLGDGLRDALDAKQQL